MTQTETFQKLFTQYECEHNHMPASARAVVAWAVENGLIDLPTIDPAEVLAGQMARALREDYGTDYRGRRYRKNHAVRVSKDGVQLTFWGIMGFAPHHHMDMAFTQRREQIVGDCCQLKIDVDVYNDNNPNQPQIEIVFDFTEDVAEREILYKHDEEED